MKNFKQFLKEAAPTMSVGNGGYTQASSTPLTTGGFDKFLFPRNIDLLDQGYQTPGETGLAKWRFSNVYPVMKVTLDNSQGDGPSIDAMVDASNKYVNIQDKNVQDVIKKNLSQFMEHASPAGKDCPSGKYYCTKRKKCMPIPSGYHVGRGGWLVNDKKNGNGNGNGNGSHNGNGNGNGNGGNGNGGGGNGGGGNGGGGE